MSHPHLLALTEYVRSDLVALVEQIEAQLALLRGDVPWDRDLTDVLATNDNCPGSLADGWATRDVAEIRDLCWHHTNGWTSPELFAQWYVTKDGGRPSTPYSIWITDTGEVLLCNELTVACWHNHNGHRNLELSVVFAGRRHEYAPSPAQMAAAVRVAVWAINSPEIPLVAGIDQMKGHMDYYPRTVCPGWLSPQSGHWKHEFFSLIESALAN